MSFEDGFEAIEAIKTSGQRLSDTIARIEKLEHLLVLLDATQADFDAILEENKSVATKLAQSSRELSAQQALFVEQVSKLPSVVEEIVDQKLSAIVAQLEARMVDRMRDELRDTRSTLRDAFDNAITRSEKQLDEAKREILAEMPRTLFGRRGR